MSEATRRSPVAFRDFINGEASGGIVLVVAVVAALIVANSSLAGAYFSALAAELGPLSLVHWIDDALMARFFLFVGLEIKLELLDGELTTWRRRAPPGVAELGGMVVPATVCGATPPGEKTARPST